MSLKKSILALGCCLALAPLAIAQNGPGHEVQHETHTTTTHTVTTSHSGPAKRPAPRSSSKTKIYNDSSRLAATLSDTQGKANIDPASWKRISGEANVLSDRIYSNASGNSQSRKAATQLRTHVRAMRTSVSRGDRDGARSHASQALPYANQLMEWSSPNDSHHH